MINWLISHIDLIYHIPKIIFMSFIGGIKQSLSCYLKNLERNFEEE